MPNFIPKSDDQLKKERELLTTLLKEGEGTFTVLSAKEKTARSGAEMIELILECYDWGGVKRNIFDYLIFNDNIFCLTKIKNFCSATGLEKSYESGKLNHFECEGKSGNLMIGIQKDKTGRYPDKNNVVSYLKQNESHINQLNDSLDDIAF